MHTDSAVLDIHAGVVVLRHRANRQDNQMPTVLSEAPINVDTLQNAAGKACALLKVLANPDRLLLLCQMSQGEYAVAELVALTGIRQPTLSQQLTVLRQEKLVATRREGRQIYYRIDSMEALAVMKTLYEMYCDDRGEP